MQHRIFEALPHLGPIHFGQDAAHRPRAPGCAPDPDRAASRRSVPGDLPCLVVEAEDHCRLLCGGSKGSVEALRSDQRDRCAMSICASASGQVYLIRPGKAEDSPAATRSGALSADVLKRLRGPLTRIAGYSAAINVLGLALSLYVLLVYDMIIATSSQDTLAFLQSARSSVWLSSCGCATRDPRRSPISRRASTARFGAGVRVRAQPASVSHRARPARLAAVALSPVRDRPRPVCRQPRVGDVRSAVHAAVYRPAVRDRRRAGLCAGRPVPRHGRSSAR